MTDAPLAWPRHDADGRTHQKVHRNSRQIAPRERPEFITEDQRQARLRAFKVVARTTKAPGRRRGGPGGYSLHAADVYEYLMSFAVKTGLIFPSYKTIASAVGCTARTAVACVAQLAAGGWLAWERRLVRVAQGGREPQVHQATNLYKLKLPDAAARILGNWARTFPARKALHAGPWTPAVPDPEQTGDVRTAIYAAREAAKRQDSHLLHHLAQARTPQAVALILLAKDRLSETLDALGQSVHSRRPSPA